MTDLDVRGEYVKFLILSKSKLSIWCLFLIGNFTRSSPRYCLLFHRPGTRCHMVVHGVCSKDGYQYHSCLLYSVQQARRIMWLMVASELTMLVCCVCDKETC